MSRLFQELCRTVGILEYNSSVPKNKSSKGKTHALRHVDSDTVKAVTAQHYECIKKKTATCQGGAGGKASQKKRTIRSSRMRRRSARWREEAKALQVEGTAGHIKA